MLCDKQAVDILFDELAGRFEDRPGGYTRILRLATPRLGDNGPRAILEFVGRNDRVVKRSEKPDFGGSEADSTNSDVDAAQ
jgi:large subunit ribosomal protein L17